MHGKKITSTGKKINEATGAVVMIHGRGGSAEDILSLAEYLHITDFALRAPQATGNSWYPYSFMAPLQQNEPWLSSALQNLAALEQELNDQGIGSDRIFFVGFSQGACLTLEYVTRHAKKYGGVVAFTGGLIGEKIYTEHYHGDFSGTPVFVGTSDPDPHVPVSRVSATTELLRKMNAKVTEKIYPGMGHTINQDEIQWANKLVFDARNIKSSM